MLQGSLPFDVAMPAETPAELYGRVFADLKPRTAAPQFEVRFRPYANLDSRIRLEPGHRKILVKVSDQLEHAPAEVQESLAYVLLGKLYRKPIDGAHEQRYKQFVNRADIRRRALEIRRQRGRKLLTSPAGGCYDLDAMFDQLNVRYFDGALDKPRLGWSVRRSRRLLGHYDHAHHTIVISRLLDNPKAPRFVVEYVLFHEMLHLKHPVEYRSGRRCVHGPAFKREERRFPQYDEANLYLKRL